MKISENILTFLGLESFYIVQDGLFCACLPLEINGLVWKVSVDTNELDINKSTILKVRYVDNIIELDIQIKPIGSDEICAFVYEITILEQKSNKIKNEFLTELSIMESKIKGWEQRKEIRYEIGMNQRLCNLMCFNDIEQILMINNYRLPCVVNNISYSGAKVTTLQGNFIKDKKVCICFSFVSPIEQIAMIGIIRNCMIKKTKDNQIISILSLEFEDSPIEYKERLTAFIKKGDKK